MKKWKCLNNNCGGESYHVSALGEGKESRTCADCRLYHGIYSTKTGEHLQDAFGKPLKDTNPRAHRNIVATLHQHLGRRYPIIEEHLRTAPIEVLDEVTRMLKDFETALYDARRDGRRDVQVRGRFR